MTAATVAMCGKGEAPEAAANTQGTSWCLRGGSGVLTGEDGAAGGSDACPGHIAILKADSCPAAGMNPGGMIARSSSAGITNASASQGRKRRRRRQADTP
jgi:hypothetical protein